MLNPSNDDRKALRQAILCAYPDPGSLEIFVDDALGKNLAAIAGGRNLEQTVFQLIQWAVAKGRIDDLVIGLYRDTPENPTVRRFFESVRDDLHQRIALDDDRAPSAIPPIPFEWDGILDDVELQRFLPKPLSFETDLGLLKRGLDRANAVCKIAFTNRQGYGTGVAIAPTLVLTNYHVLSIEEIAAAELEQSARSVRCEFGYVSTESGRAVPTAVFSADSSQAVVAASPTERLDYVLLRVAGAIERTGYIQSIPSEVSLLPSPGTGLNILQHPEGDRMKVSLSSNGIVGADERRGRIWYVNRTAGGSSGSPCFDEDWKLIALHHAEVSRGFGNIREGILYRSILAEIAPFLTQGV